MSKVIFLVPLLAVVLLPAYLLFFQSPPPTPEVDLKAWWGLGQPKEDTTIRPFKIKFTPPMIQDLTARLKNHRPFTPPLEGIAFQYGMNTKTLDSWVNYWSEKYNFTEREQFLNQFPHYKTNIQGLDIHFMRIKPENPAGKTVLPMLLVHGWPGSIREFYEAAPLLTAASKDRDFVLELIIPSLPGYGFSEGSPKPGLGPIPIAGIFRNLMHRLGYQKYYLQGGDWGSLITTTIATLFPNDILGLHLNMIPIMSPTNYFILILGSIYPPLVIDSKVADRVYPLSKMFSFIIEESGYFHIQASKPDTVGVGLADSPSGLMAYILEKFSTASNRDYRASVDGGIDQHFTKDQIIDNLMVYWSTNSMTTAMRLYSEGFNKKYFALKMDKIPTQVPTWSIQAKHEISYLPPWLIKFKFPNLLNANTIEEGGHFLALELPQVFSEDVLNSVKAFREWHKKNNVKTDL